MKNSSFFASATLAVAFIPTPLHHNINQNPQENTTLNPLGHLLKYTSALIHLISDHPQIKQNKKDNAFYLDKLSPTDREKVHPSITSGEFSLIRMDEHEREFFLGKITIEEYYRRALGYEPGLNFDPSDPSVEMTIQWRKSAGYKMQQIGQNVWNVLTSEPKKETHRVFLIGQ